MLELVTSSDFFFLVLLLWISGAFGSLFFNKNDVMANWWGNCFAILGAIGGLAFSLSVLVSLPASPLSFRIASSLPLLSVSFKVDA